MQYGSRRSPAYNGLSLSGPNESGGSSVRPSESDPLERPRGIQAVCDLENTTKNYWVPGYRLCSNSKKFGWLLLQQLEGVKTAYADDVYTLPVNGTVLNKFSINTFTD